MNDQCKAKVTHHCLFVGSYAWFNRAPG